MHQFDTIGTWLVVIVAIMGLACTSWTLAWYYYGKRVGRRQQTYLGKTFEQWAGAVEMSELCLDQTQKRYARLEEETKELRVIACQERDNATRLGQELRELKGQPHRQDPSYPSGT